MEHHIHKAEKVLVRTVALHCIHIPGIEATEGLEADTLKEDFEDLIAIARVLAEDTTDTVAEVAVRVGLNNHIQGQKVDEWYRIGFGCLGTQLGYYPPPQQPRHHQCQDRQHLEPCQFAPMASLLFCPDFLLRRNYPCCQRNRSYHWEVHHGYDLVCSSGWGPRCGSCHVSRYLIPGGDSGLTLDRDANVPNAQQHRTSCYAIHSDDLAGRDDGIPG